MPSWPPIGANLKIVSRRTKPSSMGSADWSTTRPVSWPPIARKARRLHEISHGAAAVVEGMIDDVLAKFAGRGR